MTKEKTKKEDKETELNQKIGELTETIQRVQADIENYKKQVERDNAQRAKYSRIDFINKILPILDSFELALKNTSDKEEFKKGIKPTFFHFYIRPLYLFLNKYIFRLGFLDGKNGIIICYLKAFSVYTRFQELKKMNSNR